MAGDCSRRRVLAGLGLSVLAPLPAWARDASAYVEGQATPRGLCAMAVSPAGDGLATGGMDGFVRLWDAATARPTLSRLVSGEEVFCVAWSPDGRRLAVGAGDAKVRVLSGDDLSLISETVCEATVTGVGFAADGRVAATGHGGWLAFIDPAGDIARSVATGTGGWTMTVSPDHRFAAAGNPLSLIDLSDGSVVASQGPGARETHALAFSAAGDRVASSHWNGELRVWRPEGGAAPLILRPMIAIRAMGPRNAMAVQAPVPMTGLALSPDGAVVAVGAVDRHLRFWDTTSGALLATTAPLGRTVSAMAYSADGSRLFTADLGGVVRVWKTVAGLLPEGQGL